MANHINAEGIRLVQNVILFSFFICYLAGPQPTFSHYEGDSLTQQPTFSHYEGDSLTHLMLIICHRESHNEAEFAPSAF